MNLDVFDDDALSAHESELDRMKGFYSDNEEIFKLIEKREKLWGKYLEFEVKIHTLVVQQWAVSVM